MSFASRLTYAGQSGRITSVCAVLDGASVASASSSGSLHVWRVEYTSKPGGWAPDKYRGAVTEAARGCACSRACVGMLASNGTACGRGYSNSMMAPCRQRHMPSVMMRVCPCPCAAAAAVPHAGITAVRQLSPGEGALLHVLPWANHPALLLYASQRGGVHCCDLRCAKDALHVPSAPSLGLVSQVVADPSGQHWLAQGTSRGWVTLWDVRFLLCVNSWQHPQR